MGIRLPLVSIVVPVCNGEPYIGSTLDSALAQTYRNIEVIVVDDGSRDSTRATVASRAARDSRVRLLVQSNLGVAAARNRALAEARGELVAPLDADDLWAPTKIEWQVQRMLQAGRHTGLVYCWWMWIDSGGAVLDRSPRWTVEGDGADALLQVNYTGNASVPLFRRRCLEAIGGYDVSFHTRGAQGCEDWDAALKIAERWPVAAVPSILVGYRRRADSLSARGDQMWRSYRLMIDAARERRPGLDAALVRGSRAQFLLYLSAVAFSSGEYARAAVWGTRALPSNLTFEVLPHIARAVLASKAAQRRHRVQRGARPVVRPGAPFADLAPQDPLIPYDRIYARRFGQPGAAC